MADEANIIDRPLQTALFGLIFFFGGFWLFLVLWTPYKKILPAADTNDIQRSKAAVALELQKWLILRNETGQVDCKLKAALSDVLAESESQTSQKRTSSGNNCVLTGETLPNSDPILRIDPRRASNVVIYLREKDFEAVPYPDRKGFVQALGKAWCGNLPEGSQLFLPSVYVNSIRDGTKWASYNCVFGR